MKTLMLRALLAAGIAMAEDGPVPPPTIVTPAVTNRIEIVTQEVVTVTQTVTRVVDVVVSNATLTTFVVQIDRSQNPVRFLSEFSDGTRIETFATNVPAMTDRQTLDLFNALLESVVSRGKVIRTAARQ